MIIVSNDSCGCGNCNICSYKIADLDTESLAVVGDVGNVGDGANIIASGSTGSTIFLKSIVAGENIQIANTATEIIISSTGETGISIEAFSAFTATTITNEVFEAYTGSTSTGGTLNFDGDRAITRTTINGVNAGGSTVVEFLNNLFFPAVAPGASLSGGGTRLFGNNASVPLSYTATKNTNLIASITIDGASITVTDGNTQSGSLTESLDANNTNKTFSMTVTDSAGLSGSASVSVTFRHKRFYFGDSDNLTTESDSDLSTTINAYEVGSTSEFATSKAKTSFVVSLSGEYFYYVIPASFGTPSFTINGLSNTDFSSHSFTFTNSNGYDELFVLFKTNNKLTGNFTFSVS